MVKTELWHSLNPPLGSRKKCWLLQIVLKAEIDDKFKSIPYKSLTTILKKKNH